MQYYTTMEYAGNFILELRSAEGDDRSKRMPRARFRASSRERRRPGRTNGYERGSRVSAAQESGRTRCTAPRRSFLHPSAPFRHRLCRPLLCDGVVAEFRLVCPPPESVANLGCFWPNGKAGVFGSPKLCFKRGVQRNGAGTRGVLQGLPCTLNSPMTKVMLPCKTGGRN